MGKKCWESLHYPKGEKYPESKSKNSQSHPKDVRTNPKRSIRKLASEANVSYGTMQIVLKIDLNLSPFKKGKDQVLSQTVKLKD